MAGLKICGLRDNIEEVADLGPDYAGFIFYEKSPRYVGIDFKMPVLDKTIKKVGVFVNASTGEVKRRIDNYQLDLVQLHGTESPEYCRELKGAGAGIIKAFPMDERFDFRLLEDYERAADYFLFDTKTEAFGGSGKTFDWEILKKYTLEKSYFLSGGIGLDNVGEIAQIDMSKVHALDVNSRFELRPGLKDTQAIQLLKQKIGILNSGYQNTIIK